MPSLRTKSPPGARGREAEVRATLLSAGLPVRTRRTAGDAFCNAQVVAYAMRSLGPVFQAFGQYLSSRPDLLIPRDLQVFRELRPEAAPATRASVERIVTQETGAFIEELFREFEDGPIECRLTTQTHRAILSDGTPVMVKVVRPGAEEELMPDLELLPLLEGAAAGFGIGKDRFANATSDFVQSMRHELELGDEPRWLDALVSDAEAFDLLYAPAVYRRASTAKLLTLEWPSGSGMDSPFASRRQEHARTLCVAWLRQALLGSAFPIDLSAGSVRFSDDGRVWFGSSRIDRLPKKLQLVLLEYLMAEFNQDPDKACSLLVSALHEAGAEECGKRLLLDFRQAVPYRHGGTSDLAGSLCMHWWIASSHGCIPRGQMTSFYRGLHAISAIVAASVPGSDLLAEALQDVHVMAGLARFRNRMDPGQFAMGLERYASLMMDAPRMLDEGLTSLHNGNARMKLQVSETPAQSRKRDSFAVSIALFLALPAVAVVAHQLVSSVQPSWTDRVDAAMLVLFGGWLLRSIGRAI